MGVELDDGKVAQDLDVAGPANQGGEDFDFFVVNYFHPDEPTLDGLHDVAVDGLVGAGGVRFVEKLHILEHG